MCLILEGGGQVTLCNHAIIGGVVPDSPLLSTPAEAVEAIHGVMPPVLFQGFSWCSVHHVMELGATLYVLHTMTMPTEKSQRYTMLFFCTPQKSAK